MCKVSPWIGFSVWFILPSKTEQLRTSQRSGWKLTVEKRNTELWFGPERCVWTGDRCVRPRQRRADSPQCSGSNAALEAAAAGTDTDRSLCSLGNPLKLSCPTFSSRCFSVKSGSVELNQSQWAVCYFLAWKLRVQNPGPTRFLSFFPPLCPFKKNPCRFSSFPRALRGWDFHGLVLVWPCQGRRMRICGQGH